MNYSQNSIKISFVFFLFFSKISIAQNKIIGPFLQMGSPTSMTIKWSTDSKTESKLIFGKTFNNKDKTFYINILTQDHSITINELTPNTKYYYTVGTNTKFFATDSTYYFVTSPVTGSKQKIRIAAYGDCGQGNDGQKQMSAQVQKYLKNEHVDTWLLLGDNAYEYGIKSEYQNKFFNIYQNALLKNSVLWPTLGNHDWADRTWPSVYGQYPSYFDLFTLPTNGESGGVPSKSEAFYSFDYGNVHFVTLDTYGPGADGKFMWDLDSESTKWLIADLAANKLEWTIVYFHYPPYSKGSHDSDNLANKPVEKPLTYIRERITPILEKYKVDLVLSGHSHSYERSHFMKGHTGLSNTFKPETHAVSTSNGKYNGTKDSCPYIKKDEGTVYVVAGTAAFTSGSTPGYPHKSMVYSDVNTVGVIILDVEDNRLDLKYLNKDGVIQDNFTIFKDVNKSIDKIVECGEKVDLVASWNKDFIWSNGNKNNNTIKLDSLTKDVLFSVKDPFGCLEDKFKISVKPITEPTITGKSTLLQGDSLILIGNLNGFGLASWEGPNSFKSDNAKISLAKAEPSQTGIYKLTKKYKNCVTSVEYKIDVIPLLSSETPNNVKLKVFPNPSSNELNVIVNVPQDGDYTVSFTDIAGIEVSKPLKKYLKEGKNEFKTDLNINGNAKLLLLNIDGKGVKQSFKVLIQ
jgi:acid phosphatase type 7